MSSAPEIRGLGEWRPLARGGLATVWEARELASDRLLAVKVYQRDLYEADPRHFVREAAAARRLAPHPGIVTASASGMLPDRRPYLVLELCPGGSLTRWLEPANRPSEERVRQVGLQIADALAAVHAAGVLHRDVKPANILIDRAGRPRLADFGLAAERGAEVDPADTLWLTPAWAPPEALRREPASEAGDVFSLAATLYALLSGHAPRDAGPAPAALEQPADAAQQPILPIPGTSVPLMAVLLAALDDDPAARPSATTFRGQLAQLPPPAVAPVSIAAAPGRRQNRRAGLLVLVAALAIVIVSATTWRVRVPASSGVPAPVTQSAGAGGLSPGAEPPAAAASRPPATPIQLMPSVDSAKPFHAARIRGAYPGGADRFLRVQRWEEGAWLAFPVPTKTDASGQFTAYVELGQPGRYRLRVLDPDSGVTSEPVVLLVQG